MAQATPGHRALVRRVVFDALTERQAEQLGVIARQIAEASGSGQVWSPTA